MTSSRSEHLDVYVEREDLREIGIPKNQSLTGWIDRFGSPVEIRQPAEKVQASARARTFPTRQKSSAKTSISTYN